MKGLFEPGTLPDASAVNTTISKYSASLAEEQIHRDRVVPAAHEILAIFNERYEGGLTLQDTTYATTSSLFLPYAESYATTELLAVVQAGVKNLFDRNYYYTAGYPETGRNWYVNLRYQL
jgi:outer membrane cobalamin receptor